MPNEITKKSKEVIKGKKMSKEKKLGELSKGLHRIEKELNKAFLERNVVIRALLIALVANENIALVGDPGTAKSELAGCFTDLISGRYFKKQVDAFTQPEDILGHHSLRKMREEDLRVLKTANYASEADIAYIGEGFKMSNPMMNALLLLLNEREVDIGEGIRKKANTKMIITDSNEYPTDGDLKAFWDRWLFRIEVVAIQQDSNFKHLIENCVDGDIGEVDSSLSMSMEQVQQLRSMIFDVNDSDVVPIVMHIRTELKKAKIFCSDRRWCKVMKILRANTLYNGRLRTTKKDLDILNHILWNKVDEKSQISTIISSCIGGDLHAAHRLMSQAKKEFMIISTSNIPKGSAGIQVLGPLVAKMETFASAAKDLDKTDPDVKSIVDQIDGYSATVKKMVSDRLKGKG